MMRKLAILWIVAASVEAAPLTFDSARGAKLFETLGCVQCHSISGKGGSIGPNLSRMVDRNFTPATLAATMWNHAPVMWAAMHDRDIPLGNLDEQAAADLFAFFYATRLFEKPGDAGRGKRTFGELGCANCHGLTNAIRPSIKPVAEWEVLADPVALAEAMWNHWSRMTQEAGANHPRSPVLSPQELGDILVYLRNVPSLPSKPPVFRMSAEKDAAAIYTAKGCPACHPSGAALAQRIRGQGLTEIGSALWNHAPKVTAAGSKPATLDVSETRDLLSYVWAQRFFESSGSSAAGQRVFTAKHCASCHEDSTSGAPKLAGAGRSFNGATMVSALWHHGPTMLAQMKTKGIAWPRFEGAQMSDLIAFLNPAKAKTP
jgi:cytochrome c2